MFERIRRKKPKCPNNNVIHYIIRRSRSKRQHLKHHILNIVWQSFQNEYNREARKNKTRKGEMIDKLENGVKTYQEWGMSIKQYVAVYQITEITDKFYTIWNSNKWPIDDTVVVDNVSLNGLKQKRNEFCVNRFL